MSTDKNDNRVKNASLANAIVPEFSEDLWTLQISLDECDELRWV